MYKVLLYYKYIPINDPETLKNEQMELLRGLGAKGRIIVAHEGINGTFEATEDAIITYKERMMADPRFSDIHWKISKGTPDGAAFPKLSVKVRKEIVSLHLPNEEDIDPNEITGIHLKPHELKEWYEKNREFYIVDMRNDYELKSGKFDKTIFPGMENFRDLKEKLADIKDLKNKTVLTVCTGGVRCEKASGLLKKEGFKDVYQLDGGIVTYMEQYPGQHFEGSLYVFDKRITMHFDNAENHKVIGKCERCQTNSEHYINCDNLSCHKHIICCENCYTKDGKAYCSFICENQEAPKMIQNTLLVN